MSIDAAAPFDVERLHRNDHASRLLAWLARSRASAPTRIAINDAALDIVADDDCDNNINNDNISVPIFAVACGECVRVALANRRWLGLSLQRAHRGIVVDAAFVAPQRLALVHRIEARRLVVTLIDVVVADNSSTSSSSSSSSSVPQLCVVHAALSLDAALACDDACRRAPPRILAQSANEQRLLAIAFAPLDAFNNDDDDGDDDDDDSGGKRRIVSLSLCDAETLQPKWNN